MRRGRRGLVSLLAVVAALLPVAPASAAVQGPQRFLLMFSGTFVRGGLNQGTAIGSGPVSGVGTLLNTGFEVHPDGTVSGSERLTFGPGSVTIFIRGTQDFRPDFVACYAVFDVVGDWSLGQGSGTLAGTTGSGTFTTRGTMIGVREAGGCRLEGPGTRWIVVDRAEGTATVP
jgi:hypothetical protein